MPLKCACSGRMSTGRFRVSGADETGLRYRLRGIQLVEHSVASSSRQTCSSGCNSWHTRKSQNLEQCDSDDQNVWELIDFGAWCFESNVRARTASLQLAAAQCFHRLDVSVELDRSSPMLKCNAGDFARNHVQLFLPMLICVGKWRREMTCT